MLFRCTPRTNSLSFSNIVGPFLFKDSEAPVYLTGIVGCLVSRALEIVIIIILRIIFVTANKRRDRAVAEGRVDYDERVSALEDISDWRNPAFRYVAVSSLPALRWHYLSLIHFLLSHLSVLSVTTTLITNVLHSEATFMILSVHCISTFYLPLLYMDRHLLSISSLPL